MTDALQTHEHGSGSCLCGRIRWRARAPMKAVTACHCIQCRKTSGHYAAFSGLAHSDVTVEGDVTWYQSSPEARRGFCGTCGSTLFWQPEGQPRVAIAAGSIDGASGLEITRHIFCAFKGDYYTLADGVPQLAEE